MVQEINDHPNFQQRDNSVQVITRKPYGFMQSSFWVYQSLWWFNVMVHGGLWWFVVIRGGS